MVFESFSPTIFLTPEQYLVAIKAESVWLHNSLNASRASVRLGQYIETLYRDLQEDDHIRRLQLERWLATRKKYMQQRLLELANEQALREDFIEVSQELDTLSDFSPIQASSWLRDLEYSINSSVSKGEVNIIQALQESKTDEEALTTTIAALPEEIVPSLVQPLVLLTKKIYINRLKAKVLGFENRTMLDILRQTLDYFSELVDLLELSQNNSLTFEEQNYVEL